MDRPHEASYSLCMDAAGPGCWRRARRVQNARRCSVPALGVAAGNTPPTLRSRSPGWRATRKARPDRAGGDQPEHPVRRAEPDRPLAHDAGDGVEGLHDPVGDLRDRRQRLGDEPDASSSAGGGDVLAEVQQRRPELLGDVEGVLHALLEGVLRGVRVVHRVGDGLVDVAAVGQVGPERAAAATHLAQDLRLRGLVQLTGNLDVERLQVAPRAAGRVDARVGQRLDHGRVAGGLEDRAQRLRNGRSALAGAGGHQPDRLDQVIERRTGGLGDWGDCSTPWRVSLIPEPKLRNET